MKHSLRRLARLTIGIILFIYFGCADRTGTPSKFNLEKVKKGMTIDQVRSVAGEPTAIEMLGTVTDEQGEETKMIIWYYGDNETVTYFNDTVNSIDTDLRASNERIQHIMDSAKRADERR